MHLFTEFLKNFMISRIKKQKVHKLVTHNGSFHSDDLFACAVLVIMLEDQGKKFEIIRTRDEEVLKQGDYVFDVGGMYVPELNKFDHHQRGGAGERDNGILYASFGLVWKNFGLDLCDGDEEVFNMIDRKIVAPIDSIDNGVDIVTPKFDNIVPYGGDQPFLIFTPTWQEDESETDNIFRVQVRSVAKVLRREIEVAKADSAGRQLIVEAYKNSANKQIIELPKSGFPRYLYQKTLSCFPEPIYVVYESAHTDNWKVEAITKSPDTLESRKYFPESWRGFMNNDPKFGDVTGVSDAIFCHKSGFLLTVKSKEGAMKLAELALKS
ncbi:MAG: hypothetical protein UU24_C0001G0012 [Candidatus Nomurabacteria bacterium GW2011_GWA2_40_9]|uniref:Metal-dependent protein hydrolase n=1 Tax=Candidatus Nomurabacteria bacterium GW2011_GWA2_40_9 TaxID=1618734 RepID=A0A0G0TSC2_9BACT|nr:MAG: hypothetical protein UU24_C0001G0012 [Candidatus Nomurabacteria bacterium GW2011_GWA2_40_9]